MVRGPRKQTRKRRKPVQPEPVEPRRLIGLSKREFARRAGCNESSVRQAIAHGRLAAFADGSLPAEIAESFGALATLTKIHQGTW